MMGSILTLATHLFREQLRNRTYLLLLLFGGALLYTSILVGILAVDQELRVLLDLGLGMIELTVLAAVVYAAATSILQEMESKTIYLILTRPLSKWQYLLGRFAGLILTAVFSIVCMGILHLLLLFFKGWTWQWVYPVLLFYLCLKVLLVAALATLLALISTSVISAVCMTGFLWILGHFLPEVSFLIRESRSAAAWLLKPTLYLVPNLQLFNLRDRLEAPLTFLEPSTYLVPLGYSLTYAGITLLFTLYLFHRREF